MRLRRIVPLSVALAGVLLAIGSSVTADADWRRCVTQPMVDGSRLTFLYPARLRPRRDPFNHWRLGRPQSFTGKLRRSLVAGFSTTTDGESIYLHCSPDGSGLPAGKRESPHRVSCDFGGPPRGWDVTIQDGAVGPF